MKTLNETFLILTSTLLWLVVLPLAGLFEVVVIVSDKIGDSRIHHAEMAAS